VLRSEWLKLNTDALDGLNVGGYDAYGLMLEL
jgi:hypothetical protein